MLRSGWGLVPVLAMVLWAASASAAETAPTLKYQEIRPWLDNLCFRCHGPTAQKGKVRLSDFADEAAVAKQKKLWRRVLTQIESLEMPPAGEPQPSAEQREQIARWLKRVLNTADAGALADRNPGRAIIRRLNRSEYDRTMRDLIGIEFDVGAAVGLPDDAVTHGYDNLADALNMPPVLLEKYFAAADLALDRLLGYPPEKRAPKKAYDSIYIAKPGKDLAPRAAAEKILSQFARRAYRRPVEKSELDRLLKLFDRAEKQGENFENAVKLALKGVLVSPHFLFRIEQDRQPAGSDKAYRVSDHELAVRLSYFLWSTMPDAALSAAADAGKLSDPAELEKQVKRMLADPKARALTENFAGQWLQLRKLADARPSTEFFPTFNDKVRRAMYEEAATFVDKLREEDRSVLEILDCNYTYLNEDLAKHYGIAGVTGPKMRKVTLPEGDARGGLAVSGAVLALTSHTSRTSPTLRGKWVLEVIFGTPPPPPPANAGMLKEDKKAKEPKTFRELMAQHATQPSCAGCHRKIDPLGFGLENFDAVGRWRDTIAGKPADALGELPTGEKFNGARELKALFLKRKDQFVHNLAEQMLQYALGRELQFYDEPTVAEIAAAMARNDNKFSTLILGVVKSFPFQNRRNTDSE